MSIYKNMIIQGSVFSGSPINDEVKISFSDELLKKYIPALNETVDESMAGLKALMTIMTSKEGFYKGTRSFKTNNPGNIGNTDSGSNSKFDKLEDGVEAQMEYVLRVANGKHPMYPIGKLKKIAPFYSKEIAANQKTYGLDPYLPGYRFIYTGQLDQFVKIYSTGARGGNSYLSMITSYFKNLGIHVTPQTTLKEIINIQKK